MRKFSQNFFQNSLVIKLCKWKKRQTKIRPDTDPADRRMRPLFPVIIHESRDSCRTGMLPDHFFDGENAVLSIRKGSGSFLCQREPLTIPPISERLPMLFFAVFCTGLKRSLFPRLTYIRTVPPVCWDCQFCLKQKKRRAISTRTRFFLVLLCCSGVKKAMFGDEHVTSPAAFLFWQERVSSLFPLQRQMCRRINSRQL